MLTGTILGGPQDGEFLTADCWTIVMPEETDRLDIYAEKEPSPWGSTFRNSLYDFRRDDDMRGWWVRRP